jgi:hypothetical protein
MLLAAGSDLQVSVPPPMIGERVAALLRTEA